MLLSITFIISTPRSPTSSSLLRSCHQRYLLSCFFWWILILLYYVSHEYEIYHQWAFDVLLIQLWYIGWDTSQQLEFAHVALAIIKLLNWLFKTEPVSPLKLDVFFVMRFTCCGCLKWITDKLITCISKV
jgi:hypothetical protein